MKTLRYLVTPRALPTRGSGTAPAFRGELDAIAGEFVQLVAGKYRVERVLGRGGVGIVVAATHVQLGHRVAIKMLLPKAMQDAHALRRFEREARAAAAITGDHVARVYDVGLLDTGAPYMVMEYLEGKDLSDTVEERGALPVAEAVDYMLETCEALAEAHAAGIIHRDLKPANVFLARTPDGGAKVKVLDFGMSKMLSAPLPEKPLTDAFLIMGSPGWMSPEQMRSTRDVDCRCDLWAAGAILYHMLTGRPPFVVERVAHLWAATLAATPEPPSRLRPEVPAALGAVVMRSLERDPDRRFQSAAELARALAPFASRRSLDLVERVERIASGVRSRAPVGALRGPSSRPEPERAARAPVEGPTRIEIPMARRPLRGRAGPVWLALPLAILGGAAAALAPSWSRASMGHDLHAAAAHLEPPSSADGDLAASHAPGTTRRTPAPSPAACPVEIARPAPAAGRVPLGASRAPAGDPLHPEFGDRK